MWALSVSTGTCEQAALLDTRARLVSLAGSQRILLVVTIRRLMSVTRLAEDGSHPEADTKNHTIQIFAKTAVPISECKPRQTSLKCIPGRRKLRSWSRKS